MNKPLRTTIVTDKNLERLMESIARLKAAEARDPAGLSDDERNELALAQLTVNRTQGANPYLNTPPREAGAGLEAENDNRHLYVARDYHSRRIAAEAPTLPADNSPSLTPGDGPDR